MNRAVLPRIAGPIALAALAIAVYWPALHGGWVFDDELDVTGNPSLRDAAGLWKIWFEPAGLYDYYPIKYTVQWLQWQLWGTDTLGYHATNVALHVLTAVLLCRLLRRLGVRHAWLAGVLWIVHPLMVESVAWVTELKNTLALPFLLGAVVRFIDFDEHGRRRDYVAALLLFTASLLSKTSGVMLPASLLVYQWWRRRRMDVRPLVPFFAVSLLLGLVTIWFQHHRAIGAAEAAFDPVGGWLARLACAGSALAFYAWKTIAPGHLMTIYPQWPLNSPLLLLPWVACAVLGLWFWRARDSWGRHAILGTSWFVLHLVPVLGFLPISSQRFTWVMDHLAYTSLVGAIGLIVAGVGWLIAADGPTVRRATAAVATVACAAFAVVSWRQAATFRSEEALWTHNVGLNPRAWLALYNLGVSAGNAGRSEDAVQWYRRALAVKPDYPEAWNNLGNEWRQQRKFAEAIASYQEAVRLRPAHFAAHNNLAASLAAVGRLDEAIAEAEAALRINPKFAPAHRNLGAILTSAGKLEPAIAHLREAVNLAPNFAEAQDDLGVALTEAGRRDEALPHFRRAAALRPNYAEPHFQLGIALLAKGQAQEAHDQFEAAVRIEPAHAQAHFHLGNLAAAAGNHNAALAHYEAAVRAKPQFAEAHHNTGVVLTRMGRPAEAITHLQQAVAAKPDYADALLNLALAYQAAGQMNEAVASYEAARKLRPELPPISR